MLAATPPAPIQVAFYTSHLDNAPASVAVEWEELVGALTTPTMTDCVPCQGKNCPSKFGQAWSPVDLAGGRRANVNVRAITAAVLDLDDFSHEQLEQVAPRLEGFEYVVHSTHSNAPPLRYALRLVMPLVAPVPASHWQSVLKAIISAFQLPVRTEDAGGVDPNCKDLARLYFLPSAPVGTQPFVVRGRGMKLDAAALLQLEQAAPQQQDADASLDNLPGTAVSDLNELRKRLVQVRYRKARSNNSYDRERYEILDRILRGQALASPGARDNTINQASALIAFALPPRTPTRAALELMMQSLHGMQVQPEGLEHWVARATFSYDRAMLRRLERDAKNDQINANLRARLAGMAGRSEHGSSPQAALPPHVLPASPLSAPPSSPPSALAPWAASDAPTNPPSDASADWRNSLIFKKGEDRTLASCGENVFQILNNAPETKGCFVWDDMEKIVRISGGEFEHTPVEILDAVVTDWLQRAWNLSVDITVVGKRIERAARENSTDPLADFLNSLPAKWDGKQRITRYLIDYCGAKCTSAEGRDITSYVEQVSRRWFISLVARGLNPGCQVDTVLILEGLEGFFKTSMFRVLGERWFSSNQITLGDKDSLMLAASNWIIEMAELASWRKADSYGMNALITQLEDKFRMPYGRAISTAPRRCVFVGTINPDEGGFFQNAGGVRRRYWPITITREIDIDRIRADRDQILAEAVLAYVAGERWWFTRAEQEEANAQVEERLVESHIPSTIAAWWFGLSPAQRPAELSAKTVAEQALRYQAEKIQRPILTEIGIAIKQLKNSDGSEGFSKKRVLRDKVMAYLYFPSDEMKNATQRSGLRVIPGGGAASAFGKKT